MPVIQQNNSQQMLFFVFPCFHIPILKEHLELLGEYGQNDSVVSVKVTGTKVCQHKAVVWAFVMNCSKLILLASESDRVSF